MDIRDLDGMIVVGVFFQRDAPELGYVRGFAAWNGGELRVISEAGQGYSVPASFASIAQVVTESVREAAPAALQPLLAGADFVIPIPPPAGNFALAATPGWLRTPAT